MVTNNPNPEENQNPNPDGDGQSNLPQNYEDVVTEEPERQINLGNFQPPKTIDEEEEDAGHLSDFKTYVRAITPRFKHSKLNELMQTAMPSRVFPDNYMDKHFLIAAALMEEDMEKPEYDPVSLISQTQDGLSIAYEGRHIIDLSEGFGVAREQELEKLSKDLGL